MSLKTKLFTFLVITPFLLVGYLLFLVNSTFVATQTNAIYENQIQLLNSVHLLLGKIDSRDLAESTKNLFVQEGLQSLIISDSTGRIRYAGDAKIVGKPLVEILGDKIQSSVQEQTAEEGSFETVGAGNEKLLVSFFKFELADNRYFMLLAKPKSIALRASLLFIFKSIGALIALFVAFLFGSRLTYNGLNKGLAEISKAMEALAQGNWLTKLPVSGADEVGELSKNFSSMRKQLFHFFQEDQKKTRLEAQADFSKVLRNLYLSPGELKLESLQLAASLDNNQKNAVFWNHCLKSTDQGSFLLFLLAEAPEGEALAALSGVCRWALESDPKMTGTQDLIKKLNDLIGVTFGKTVSWNYCLCSLNLTTGVLDWTTLSYTTPTPIVLNSEMKNSQPGNEGRIKLKKGDFIILHSDKVKPELEIEKHLVEKSAAKELLQLINPSVNQNEEFDQELKVKTTKTIDQSYLVVKWENTL